MGNDVGLCTLNANHGHCSFCYHLKEQGIGKEGSCTVRMDPKHSSATVAAEAEAVSISAVYFMLSLLKTLKDASRKGRQARLSALSSKLVMNMSTRPNMATTVDRNAMEIDIDPALFISLVSCIQSNATFLDLAQHA